MDIFKILRAVLTHRFGGYTKPYFGTYFITMRCNLRCLFCDVWKNKKYGSECEMSLEQVESLFSKLKSLDVIRISGGEPFLRSDIADVVEIIDREVNPSVIHITSNGTITDRIVNTLKYLPFPRKVHIKISIDAVGKEHDKIRGMNGVYEAAMRTIRELAILRREKKFHLGVNCTLAGKDGIDEYIKLQNIMNELEVPVYSVIAGNSETALYSGNVMSQPEMSIKTYGDFSKDDIKRYLKIYMSGRKTKKNLPEFLIDNYHINGLINRLFYGMAVPNPKCVALSSHIRVLPNGDIPVCLYNGNIVGNLLNSSLDDIWNGESAKKWRNWVKKCSGCWQSCEMAVNAVYTGDIIRSFFIKSKI